MEQFMEQTTSWADLSSKTCGPNFFSGGSANDAVTAATTTLPSITPHDHHQLTEAFIGVIGAASSSGMATLTSSSSTAPNYAHHQYCNGAMSYPFDDALASTTATSSSSKLLADASSSHEQPPTNCNIIHTQPPIKYTRGGATKSWCHSYLSANPARPMELGKRKIEDELQDQLLRNDASCDMGTVGEDDNIRRGTSQDGLFRIRMGQQAGSSVAVSQQQQQTQQADQGGGQGAFVALYGTQTAATAVTAGAARPRIRARRGQATDPHSIAERLRRERIAERMKALQELVPNSNKTDKASMLDEIIEYVKFLQLQVKVLSMSRLGGAPLNVADVPLEDGMAVAERQVARLMEEDMGSAMQYLQAKGLCLMPVSLANVISANSSSTRPPAQAQLGGILQQAPRHQQTSTAGAAGAAASNSCAHHHNMIGGGGGDLCIM